MVQDDNGEDDGGKAARAKPPEEESAVRFQARTGKRQIYRQHANDSQTETGINQDRPVEFPDDLPNDGRPERHPGDKGHRVTGTLAARSKSCLCSFASAPKRMPPVKEAINPLPPRIWAAAKHIKANATTGSCRQVSVIQLRCAHRFSNQPPAAVRPKNRRQRRRRSAARSGTQRAGRCFIVDFFQAAAAPNLGGCHQFRIIAARLA